MGIKARVMKTIGHVPIGKNKAPMLSLKVTEQPGNFSGCVVAGQIFWMEENVWKDARCLMCFRESTRLDAMFCSASLRIPSTLDEVFVSPSHVVKRLDSKIGKNESKKQQEKENIVRNRKRGRRELAESNVEEDSQSPCLIPKEELDTPMRRIVLSTEENDSRIESKRNLSRTSPQTGDLYESPAVDSEATASLLMLHQEGKHENSRAHKRRKNSQ